MVYHAHDEPFDPSAFHGQDSYELTSYDDTYDLADQRLIDKIPNVSSYPRPTLPPSSYPGPSREIYDRNAYPPEKSKNVLAWRPSTEWHPESLEEPFKDSPNSARDLTLSRARASALAEVDNAKFFPFRRSGLFFARVCFIAGIGFFVDAYDIFSINIAVSMIAFVTSNGQTTKLAQDHDALLKAAAPVGNFIGQLFFGWMADRIGRKRMYGIELIIIIIGAFGQALATNNSIGTINVIATLCVWRFIMGLGIGGDYPLSSVITAEFAPKKVRGRMMTVVFASQGWGQLVASIVGCLTVLGFQSRFSAGGAASCTSADSDCPILKDMDRCWRILVGLGCVPAAIGLWSRLSIPESPRFTMDIERNVKQAADDIDNFLQTGTYKYDPDSVVIRVKSPRASIRDFRKLFSQWENAKVLIGCAVSWLAIDVTFYGLGLNTDKFFNAIGFQIATDRGTSDSRAVFQYFTNFCIANMFLSVAGLIPGYWMTFLLIDHRLFGRKRIQLQGFIVLTLLFIVLAPVSKKLVVNDRPSDSLFNLSRDARRFIALLCLVGFFQNFGPNTTTFIIPGELFPTRYRSTCHGISAASGKLGAIISQFVIARLDKPHIIFAIYTVFAFIGILSTLLLPETRAKTLEENSNEDQELYAIAPVRPVFTPVP